MSLWENGKTVPTLNNLRKLVSACGVDLPTFFGAISESADKPVVG